MKSGSKFSSQFNVWVMDVGTPIDVVYTNHGGFAGLAKQLLMEDSSPEREWKVKLPGLRFCETFLIDFRL
jgi:hypothetical protein